MPDYNFDSLCKKFPKSEDQRSLKYMADTMLAYGARFPKVRKLYLDCLRPKSVSDLMAENKNLSQLFNAEAILEKLSSFMGPNIPRFAEEVVTTHASFLLKDLENQSSSFKERLRGNVTEFVKKAEAMVRGSKKLVANIKRTKLPTTCYGLLLEFFSRLHKHASTVHETSQAVSLLNAIKAMQKELLEFVASIVKTPGSQYPDNEISSSDIELWNTLTSISWDDDFGKVWIHEYQSCIRLRVIKTFKAHPLSMLEFYAEKFEHMKPVASVEKFFAEVVMEEIETSAKGYGFQAQNFIFTATGHLKPKILKVFEKVFINKWFKFEADAMEGEKLVVEFFFKWSVAADFVKMLASEDLKKSLNVGCKSALEKCKAAIKQVVKSLEEGTIGISTLENYETEDFVAIYKATHKENKDGVDAEWSETNIRRLIEHRKNELKHFRDVCLSLQHFVDSCSRTFKDEIFTEEQNIMEVVSTDYSEKPLSSAMMCQPFKPGKSFPTTRAALTVFQLTDDVIDEVANIQNSGAFKNLYIQEKLVDILQQKLSQDQGLKLDLGQFLLEVWTPVRSELFKTLQNINDGSISIHQLQKMFKGFTKKVEVQKAFKNLSELYRHYQTKDNGLPDIELGQMVYKVAHCFVLLQTHTQAKKIDALREKLALKPFDQISNVLEIAESCKDKPFSSITQEVTSTTNDLQKISPEMLKVIKACGDHVDLIEWLKQNMKNIGEVTVMSDLAMISAGETPMEVDRVSCFLSAVMGFAPIIFDLPKDADWSKFLKACKEVLQNVSRDQNLLEKWDSTAKELEWLKTTKDLHGSVEKSSLKRARDINHCGVYIVGNEHSKVPEMEDCLKVKIPKQDGNDDDGSKKDKPLVEMTFSELRDLQSRLMLIAGEAEKGKQEVDRFISVLSVIEKLTKAYVKIRTSGCLLFNNWEARINCNDQCQGATVKVFFDKASPAITSGDRVVDEVHNLTTVIEDAHKEWLHYLNEKRALHYHLNHFNIHQLTYLSKNLANSEDKKSFPDQVYCLLDCVLQNATYDQIIDALDDATRIKDDQDMDSESSEKEEESESLVEKKSKLVRQLVQGDLEERVAKAAVQVSRSYDIDDCYLWALEHFDDENILSLEKAFDEEVGACGNRNKIGVVKDIIKDKMDMTLKEVIEHIQIEMEEKEQSGIATFVKTICERYLKGTSVTSLSDCVSLEHLGLFLFQLSQLNRNNVPPYREWSDLLITGKPNLIICTPNSMWRSILSIYALSPEQPLPSATEVLVCSDSTTSEEVGLLLRRALGENNDDGQRIYCLACVDQLSFTTSKEVEETFQQLLQNPHHNDVFRLVVLASSAQHYISTCFDEHQVTKINFPSEKDLKSYVKDHLKVDVSKEESCAIADPERSTVRMVYSERSGNGKSLFIQRCRESLEVKYDGNVYWNTTVLRLLEKSVDIHDVTDSLLKKETVLYSDPHFIHIDITPSVGNGAGKFFFDLLFLGSVTNSYGVIWRKDQNHYYAIEYTQPAKGFDSFMPVLDLLPTMNCLAPNQVQQALNVETDNNPENVLMDKFNFLSDAFQRPYQYLLHYANGENLDGFQYSRSMGTPLECLTTLLKFCSIQDPSWAEISHFASFLNVQLTDCENSDFCNQEIVLECGLLGFKQFVVRFMIRMSQDFATPSLQVDHSLTRNSDIFELHQLRRRWESGLHPYLFFNDDRHSMSFVHFNIDTKGNLCNPVTKEIVQESVMTPDLRRGLKHQRVSLEQNFDSLSRRDKIETLCGVFGVQNVFDPDPSYELTTDNVLKMLAIHMRFRCNIPVVIMGETGCGKTRMVEFMSKLKAGGDAQTTNLIVVKVHGGITAKSIQARVEEAVALAENNQNSETILFLDEANTTEAIYAIKEIVCDHSVHGMPFLGNQLKIVAACNPYRKHTDEEISAMESCGLGFNVKSSKIKEKFADIPMRHLVYRVIPLPPSMQPLVWDFGQLNAETELMYIRQMVDKLAEDLNNRQLQEIMPVMTQILSHSQTFMRNTTDVCRFVSLRDVERAILSFKWFFKHIDLLNPKIDEEKSKLENAPQRIGNSLRALIQALGVCYHATLNKRRPYRELVCKKLQSFIRLNEKEFLKEIVACQNVFINAIEVENDIARNEALRENVFMMIVCAEMRIPLFLVGKPGSSKSLAKTIVTKAMQGGQSRCELFRELKQIHVSSFQCSPVSDAAGIETMFNQCAQIQSKQDLSKFVAVVVLDEIGLAEDSPKMPLKVLHPLLEVGSTSHTSFDVPEYCKVGFVGISNWALDPAKMNRGIFVTRGEPTKNDLEATSKAFFKSNESKFEECSAIITGVTKAYLKVCKSQRNSKEFFGLRDYYGLLKMLYNISLNKEVEYQDIAMCVLRNFSGSETDVFRFFTDELQKYRTFRPQVTVVQLVQENLHSNFENRFLLLLTKQYSAVSFLPQVIESEFQVIFGSSFPRDHDYTEICRNINKIKVCMESGRTVVLLNLQELYESLYDALNQQYVTFAGQRYVDLGLGGHRVKCRIAENFKLIVIEEKEVVYAEFPIPLINRLEKHIFEIKSVLNEDQHNIVERLEDWAKAFANVKKPNFTSFSLTDAFVGYQDDSLASAALSCVDESSEDKLSFAKQVLLQTASLDAVVRLPKSKLEDVEYAQQVYSSQSHETLDKLLSVELQFDMEGPKIKVFEVVSYSMCLNDQDRIKLEKLLNLPANYIWLITLQQLQTEEEYTNILNDFFDFATSSDRNRSEAVVILIQCPQAQKHSNLIACAKYCAMNKVKQLQHQPANAQIVVAFIFSLERSARNSNQNFTTFHSNDCISIYVDELRPGKNHIGMVGELMKLSVADILELSSSNYMNEENTNLVDISNLLQVAIPEAIACLSNQDQSLSRNRVKILLDLCEKWQYKRHFVCALLNLVVKLLKERENYTKESWVVREACSSSALEEGGSFRNTLWLRLRQLVSLSLARIIAVADVDNNLDLLWQDHVEQRHTADLWIKFFKSPMCKVDWPKEYNNACLKVVNQSGFSCQFPFSRLIINELHHIWTVVDQSSLEEKVFYEKIKRTGLAHVLNAAAENKKAQNLIERFVNDLIRIIYKPSSETPEVECNALKKSVLSLFNQARKRHKRHENAFLEIFVLVMKLLKEFQLFGEVVSAHSKTLDSWETWIIKQNQCPDFILHSAAFETIIKHLEKEAPEIGNVKNCHVWKNLVAKLKYTGDAVAVLGDDALKLSWNLVKFVEIFLEQLIPKKSKFVKEYVKTLAPLARRLWTGASKLKNLAGLQFLRIITKTLEGCCKDIQLKMLCSWQDTRCRMCRVEKVKTPVKLSCGHFICYECINLDEDSCPNCRRPIENIENLEPVQLTRDQNKELDSFKTACTSFFLEYLSTFCFPDPESASASEDLHPPDQNILAALESLVICDKKTQRMSPNLSTFDTNPTARSYILQLLMRCNREMVKNQLNHHFDQMAGVIEDKNVLMDIYIQCTHDMLSNRSHAAKDQEMVNTKFATTLLKSTKENLQNPVSQIDHLDLASNMLFISRVMAECIYFVEGEKVKSLKNKREMKAFLATCFKFVKDKLIMKHHVVKYLCRRYGMDAFNYLLQNDTYKKNLVPHNFMSDDEKDDEFYLQCDNFILAGPIYIQIKKMLVDIAQEDDLQNLLKKIISEIQKSPNSLFQIMLALSTWSARSAVNSELRVKTYNFICKHIHMHLAGNVHHQIFSKIHDDSVSLCKLENISQQMQYKVADLVTMAALTFVSNNNGLLADFHRLTEHLERLQNSFLPTMPASNFFEVRDVMMMERSHYTSPKAYQCPEGHVYFIGECTNPNQRGKCPDCGKAIGGRAHGLLEVGNTVGELTEQSQAGYLLKNANERLELTPERSLTKPSVCALRVCLHSAMLLGAQKGKDTILRMIKTGVDVNQVEQFLLCQLVKDLEQLAECIGKSVDDAIMLMHHTFHQMGRLNRNIATNHNLSSMDSRKKWEEDFQKEFLSLVFRNSDQVLGDAQQAFIASGDLAEKPLHRVVYELSPTPNTDAPITEWADPNLWKYRTHIDIHHLKRRLEAVDHRTAGDGSMLKVLLNTEHLSLIQDLLTIFNVQRAFITRYQNKVDIKETDNISLEDFLNENENYLEGEIDIYIATWNKVHKNLAKYDRYNTLRQHLNENMSRESAISMCLPTDCGRGCCALVLAEYFIELQNEILVKAHEIVETKPEFKQIDVSDVESKHLICISEAKDLMPIILANSQYETPVTNDRPQHTITYNLDLLQKKVLEKFVLGKRIIKRETIPRMTYPQDVGFGKVCNTLKDEVEQVPLSAKISQAVETIAKNARKADICEAVRYITLVIQLLSKLGGEKEQTICEYAEKELRLTPDETSLIPRSAKLSHCFALYEALSLHRALKSVQIGQNPFKLVRMTDDMVEKLKQRLEQSLAQMKQIELFLLELNSLMMVGPDLQEDWSLRDVLYEYIDGKHDNAELSWYESFPAEVLVKHAKHVFTTATKFQN